MHTPHHVCLAAALLLLPAVSHAQSERCARGFAEAGALLGRLQFARAWREVTMDDGKPLTLQISGEGPELRLSFIKAGEGLWAEGPVRVCRRAARVFAEIAGPQLRVGPAAGWAMRQLLAGGATFELAVRDNGQLRVALRGWSGDFEAVDEQLQTHDAAGAMRTSSRRD